jgi:hypothetical protein
MYKAQILGATILVLETILGTKKLWTTYSVEI